jgi:hydroxymethylbilane synthase
MLGRRPLRIGTRGSKLARWQADWVTERLRALGQPAKILEIATSGDVEQIAPVAAIGSTGAFTKEIQRAVLAGEVDLAVHSLKDLPTEAFDNLILAAVPERENPADVLVLARGCAANMERHESTSTDHSPLDALSHGARIGTGSLRRQAQLRNVRPDLCIENIRGNVDTRLRKLDEGQFDAIVLAEAGLKRLGLGDRISQVLPFSNMLPAVGQGALAIECRADNSRAIEAVQPLGHAATKAAVTAERSMLAHLRGGCLAPIGAWGRVENGLLVLSAVVLSTDGTKRLAASKSATPSDAVALGRRVADSLLARGAAELIDASRSGFSA